MLLAGYITSKRLDREDVNALYNHKPFSLYPSQGGVQHVGPEQRACTPLAIDYFDYFLSLCKRTAAKAKAAHLSPASLYQAKG